MIEICTIYLTIGRRACSATATASMHARRHHANTGTETRVYVGRGSSTGAASAAANLFGVETADAHDEDDGDAHDEDDEPE